MLDTRTTLTRRKSRIEESKNSVKINDFRACVQRHLKPINDQASLKTWHVTTHHWAAFTPKHPNNLTSYVPLHNLDA
jgi:hypothetical protein